MPCTCHGILRITSAITQIIMSYYEYKFANTGAPITLGLGGLTDPTRPSRLIIEECPTPVSRRYIMILPRTQHIPGWLCGCRLLCQCGLCARGVAYAHTCYKTRDFTFGVAARCKCVGLYACLRKVVLSLNFLFWLCVGCEPLAMRPIGISTFSNAT